MFFLIGFSPGKGVVSSGTSASPLTSHSSLLCRAWEAFLSWPDSDTQHAWLLVCQGASLGECQKGLEELGTDCSTFISAWILLGLLPKALAFPERMVSVLWVSPSPDWWGLSAGSGMVAPLPALCSGGSAGLEHCTGKIP